ncbi:MAG: efflux RND transporter periplasmic adaptor subunit [Bacteroidales bacterium]|nr:efflux RND transporter periplasmic adaptor subunit [Bacteroidales bacterium]
MKTGIKLHLCLLAASGIALTMSGCKEKKEDGKTRSYDVLVLEQTSRELSTTYSATIRGKQDIDIRPKVSGYITDIFVKEGSYVSKGKAMFIIDQDQYQAALQTAIANVNVAKAAVDAASLTLESKEKLFNQNIISNYEYQLARTTLEKEKAQLALAKANETNARNNLAYTVVKSPADGVVGTLPFRVGTLVGPNDATPLTSVSDNSEMYVYFSMTESQVLSLTRQFGSLENALQNLPSIELELNDGTIFPEQGRIEAISGIIDPNTGAITVRAKFPNRSRLLLSGGSGNVIMPYHHSDCIVIPQSATYEIQDKVFVFTVENGAAKSTMIDVFPISNGKEYVVESGIAPGDTIVAEGVGLLRDGSSIEIKNIISGDAQ